DGVRRATVVVERTLGTVQGAPGLSDTFALPTSLAPVTLRARASVASAPPRVFTFVIAARDGGFVLEAEVSPAALAAARAHWRQMTRAAMLGVVAVTLLLCTGPIIDRRRQTRDVSRFLATTALLIVVLVGVRGVLYFALTPIAPTPAPTPFDLLLTTLTMATVVWLVLDLTERRRFARPLPRMLAPAAGAAMTVAAGYFAAGLANGWLLWGYERVLQRVVADTNLDLLHFSLHPVSASRLAVEFALVLLHAAVIWGAAASIRVPAAVWRTPRALWWRVTAASAWLAGALAATTVAGAVWPPVPIGPLWVALLVAGVSAMALAEMGGRM